MYILYPCLFPDLDLYPIVPHSGILEERFTTFSYYIWSFFQLEQDQLGTIQVIRAEINASSWLTVSVASL